jgi:hypothetical protein
MKKNVLKALALIVALLFSACGEDLLIGPESAEPVSREQLIIIGTSAEPEEPLSAEPLINENSPEQEDGTIGGLPGGGNTPEPEPLSEEPVINETPPEEEGEVTINIIMQGADGENIPEEPVINEIPPGEEGEITIRVIMQEADDAEEEPLPEGRRPNSGRNKNRGAPRP